ncbi:MAG: YARHG domain-containing protein [Ruminococcus sp.]|nr:YARHG domain-containing protein [Ruminococcus sp.]
MRSKKLAGKYLVILLIISIIPFMLCSCGGFSEAFDKEKEITSISLSENDINLTVGESRVIEAKAYPEDSINKVLTWTSSNDEIATVKGGTITAKKAGSVVVKVEAQNGVNASCNVTVTEREITKITLSDETATLKVGQTIQIEAKVTPVGAKTDELVWSSDAQDIAKVNSSGYVTGVNAGIANIVCKTPNGVEASCTVTVRAAIQATASSTSPTQPTTDDETEPTKARSDSNNSVLSNHKYNGCIFPDSSSRKLTVSEVSKLSDSEAQQAINEIYARNGYIFKTESIQEYFEAQSWYTPRGKVDIGDLSEIEQYNISLLQKYR